MGGAFRSQGAKTIQSDALLGAKLLTTTYEQPVEVRNLSARGTMLGREKLPPVGCDIVIRRGPLEIFAAVAWVSDGRCGVEFDQPLSEDELWRQANPREAEQVHFQVQHWRPSIRHCVRPTAEECEAARAWVNPPAEPAYLG